MADEQVVEDGLFGELLELVGLDTPSKPSPQVNLTKMDEEGILESLIETAEAKEVPVDEELPVVEKEEEEEEETPVEPLSELEEAQVTITKLTEALNNPLESMSIPTIEPVPVQQEVTVPQETVVPQIPKMQPQIASIEPVPVQQNTVPAVPQLTQETFDQILTSPDVFEAHLKSIATQAAQQSREQTLLEMDSLVDKKMNARASVENEVKTFFAGKPQQDIVTRNHSPLVVMQAELVQQASPNVPLSKVLQHATNMVRQQVGLPVVDYSIPQVQSVVESKTKTPSPQQRHAVPTHRRQAEPTKEDPNSLVNQIISMAPSDNGINTLL